MNAAQLRSLNRYGLVTTVLMIVLAACGGTTPPTQVPAFVPTNVQATPAPDCPDPKQAETVARQFFVALNAYGTDVAVGLISPDIRLYADATTGFFEEKHNIDNIRAYLTQMAGKHDQFAITTVNAKVDPSPRTIEYYVEIPGVVRKNDDLTAKQKVAKGTITLSVHCDTLKIGIIGLETRVVAQ